MAFSMIPTGAELGNLGEPVHYLVQLPNILGTYRKDQRFPRLQSCRYPNCFERGFLHVASSLLSTSPVGCTNDEFSNSHYVAMAEKLSLNELVSLIEVWKNFWLQMLIRLSVNPVWATTNHIMIYTNGLV